MGRLSTGADATAHGRTQCVYGAAPAAAGAVSVFRGGPVRTEDDGPGDGPRRAG